MNLHYFSSCLAAAGESVLPPVTLAELVKLTIERFATEEPMMAAAKTLR
jgi:hypothetical protein